MLIKTYGEEVDDTGVTEKENKAYGLKREA